MKEHLQLIAATALILLLIPLVGYAKKTVPADTETAETVSIYLTGSGETLTLSMHDYIVGAVAAQMPAELEPSALEAQAVLAATYARCRHLSESENPTPDLHGADMSDDGTLYQAFFTEQQAKEVYGEDYGEALKKLSAAADKAEGLTLTYDGRPILVAFHAVSPGATESALTMWGEDIPYLTSVDSPQDRELEECVSMVDFSDGELSARLKEEFGDLSDKPEELFSPASVSDNGTVLTVRIGSSVFPAERFCTLLGLRSQNFTAEHRDGRWRFTVYGCGHLVGMSQYGANEMAKSGSSASEILLHYFPGTEIKKAREPQ
ncbi:MAG: stage II sporulation protein D [Ruminococcus sp.]|nr:stage II sporulation protein D [Ruminococcus sp.]